MKSSLKNALSQVYQYFLSTVIIILNIEPQKPTPRESNPLKCMVDPPSIVDHRTSVEWEGLIVYQNISILKPVFTFLISPQLSIILYKYLAKNRNSSWQIW